MAKRRRRVRRKPPVEEVEEVLEEEELDDEELEEEYEDDDYEDDDDEEEEEPAPVRRKRRARKVVEDEEPEEEPAPVRRKRKAKPKKKKKVEEPDEAEGVAIKKVDTVIAEDVLTGLLEAIDDGGAITITRVSGSKWEITTGKPVGRVMTPAEIWRETASPEFLEWNEEWSGKTFAEKKAYAKKLKVKWDPHDDQRIEVMRISQAVRNAEGIEKYKPEYQTRAARQALKTQGL